MNKLLYVLDATVDSLLWMAQKIDLWSRSMRITSLNTRWTSGSLPDVSDLDLQPLTSEEAPKVTKIEAPPMVHASPAAKAAMEEFHTLNDWASAITGPTPAAHLLTHMITHMRACGLDIDEAKGVALQTGRLEGWLPMQTAGSLS